MRQRGQIKLGVVLTIMTLFFPVQCWSANFKSALLPNDTIYNYQNYLKIIQAEKAWDIVKESPDVVVAVIDSGVDIDHPDLAENIWHNLDEIPNDGLDNDNNGYVDDTVGWDFVLNTNDPRPKFAGSFSKLGVNHGTIVAGVIGNVGNNNFGLAGLSWRVKIMPLRVMDGEGSGSTNLVYQAVKYAMANGANIINLSMVGDAYDPLLVQIIKEAYQQGLVIVASAGNENSPNHDIDISLSLDLHPQYPICHDGDNGANYVLGVGSVSNYDVKSIFSNFGKNCLDLVAPGESFFGTLFFSPVLPDYRSYFGGYWSGTSLAAPQVAATAALVKTLRPNLTNKEIYQLIVDNTDNIDAKNPSFAGLLGKGRLNVYKVLSAAGGQTGGVNLVVTPASQYLPEVAVVNKFGEPVAQFLSYQDNFLGGVNTAAADLDKDGQKEVVTAPAAGGGPHLKIFNSNGRVLSQFFVYPNNFLGGVNVAAGDVNGDGVVEIITAPAGNYEPQVKIFNAQGQLLKEFLAFNKNFHGGVNVAISDINADSTGEIVAAAAAGGGPQVRIFNEQGKLLSQFFADDSAFTGGIKVAAFDIIGDPRTEIITVPASKKDCQVSIFSASGNLEQKFAALGFNNGCNLTAGRLDGASAPASLIISSSAGNGANVAIYNQAAGLKNSFIIFSDDFSGGVYVTIK